MMRPHSKPLKSQDLQHHQALLKTLKHPHLKHKFLNQIPLKLMNKVVYHQTKFIIKQTKLFDAQDAKVWRQIFATITTTMPTSPDTSAKTARDIGLPEEPREICL